MRLRACFWRRSGDGWRSKVRRCAACLNEPLTRSALRLDLSLKGRGGEHDLAEPRSWHGDQRIYASLLASLRKASMSSGVVSKLHMNRARRFFCGPKR